MKEKVQIISLGLLIFVLAFIFGLIKGQELESAKCDSLLQDYQTLIHNEKAK